MTQLLTATGYMTGFGNHHATEAEPGALPVGRNSPQRPPLGLYPEQLSGAPFTAPRAEQRRSWLYRIRPSAAHGAFRLVEDDAFAAALDIATPNRLRWDPPAPIADADLIGGLRAVAATGARQTAAGITALTYYANRASDRVFFNADGELLFVPVEGRLTLFAEFGRLEVAPGSIAMVPRGVRFRAELPDGAARGYACENHGQPFRLPELGAIGSNGLANPRDFETPVAAYELGDQPTELVQKFAGRLWSTTLDHSPLDVVAWHGNLAPWRYDLSRFNTLGTVSFDHPDPSIFTVLTSPTDTPGTANCDFAIFPPRWMVAEDTLRPPRFHLNIMSEAMGLITGVYDAKADRFAPGGLSLHNLMAGHGPDVASWQGASNAELKPHKIDGTMAFMVESCWPYRPTAYALAHAQPDYDAAWAGFPKARLP